ncbi:MAG: hypothetical protein ACHQFW_12355 [Chitinophagales bacterium]
MSKTEFLINVHARFLLKHSSEPLHGNHYRVRLFDKDPINDDFLGETELDKDGKVHFRIDPKYYRSEDNPLETKPDFYIVVMKEERVIFKTPVAPNIDLNKDGNFNYGEGEWIDLGTFVIEE